MNRKRAERFLRFEGLWLNDGSCIRLRPEYLRNVWAYDFVDGRTHDGRKFRILAIIDEASRECVAVLVARRIRSVDVLAILAELFVIHGRPAHIRSDNGPEFIATAVKEWLSQIVVQTLYCTPSSPRKNGYCESFNGSSLGYRPFAPEAVPRPLPSSDSAPPQLRPALAKEGIMH